MSQVPWHAITSLVDDLDEPFFVVVNYGSGYQYFSGILRTFDILGNITISDGEEHIFHNGFHASRKMNKLIRNEIFEDYFIDPETAIITDKNGVIQQLSLYKDGWLRFKRMAVHKIQMHTNYGYDKDKDIHHKDGNKTNNSLDNLIY